MKVYIAAPFPLIVAARKVMDDLAAHGIGCTSRWLTDGNQRENDEWARKDLSDVAACDVFVALNPIDWAEKGTGGRHVELGAALMLHKPIVLVGQPTNIFHRLSILSRVDFEPHGFQLLPRVIREADRVARSA